MTWKFWINAASLTALTGAGLLPPLAAPAQAQVASVLRQTDPAGDLDRLLAAINDPASNSTPAQREEAARQLLSRPGEGTRGVVLEVLSGSNSRAQVAVAKALGTSSRRDEEFKNPLFVLIRNDPTAEAAGQALAGYVNEPTVLDRLIRMAASREESDATRAAAAKALSASVEKRAAAALVALLDDGGGRARAAAVGALVDLTAIRTLGNEPAEWRRWWQTAGNTPEEQFRAEVRERRMAEASRDRQRLDQLFEDLYPVLSRAYQDVPEARKGPTLVGFLQQGEPAMRMAGARIFFDQALNAAAPPAAREQLRRMVSDSDAKVRLEVVKSLSAVNDVASLQPMILQLRRERDADVRTEIARALSRFGEVEAVPVLVELLSDESLRVSTTAARSLQGLAPKLREKYPQDAARVAEEINRAMRQHAGQPGAEGREAYVEAMAPFQDAGLLDRYAELLTPRERPEVRKAALKCLGALQGSTRAADAVISSNAIQDSDPAVRLEAIRALRFTATFESAQMLYLRSLEPAETNPAVREAAWDVLKDLFQAPGATVAQLWQWEQKFRGGPKELRATRSLAVLEALLNKYLQSKDDQGLAVVRENLGYAYAELGDPQRAVLYFQPALDYWRQKLAVPKDPNTIPKLSKEIVRCHLAAKEYDKAFQFAADAINRDPGLRGDIGAAIKLEAYNLARSEQEKDWRAGVSLVNGAEKINLAEYTLTDLRERRAEMQRKIDAAAGRTPNPQGLKPPTDMVTRLPGWLLAPV